jgi:hypothetical protein
MLSRRKTNAVISLKWCGTAARRSWREQPVLRVGLSGVKLQPQPGKATRSRGLGAVLNQSLTVTDRCGLAARFEMHTLWGPRYRGGGGHSTGHWPGAARPSSFSFSSVSHHRRTTARRVGAGVLGGQSPPAGCVRPRRRGARLRSSLRGNLRTRSKSWRDT